MVEARQRVPLQYPQNQRRPPQQWPNQRQRLSMALPVCWAKLTITPPTALNYGVGPPTIIGGNPPTRGDTVLTEKLSDPVALQKRGFATVAYITQWIGTLQRCTKKLWIPNQLSWIRTCCDGAWRDGATAGIASIALSVSPLHPRIMLAIFIRAGTGSHPPCSPLLKKKSASLSLPVERNILTDQEDTKSLSQVQSSCMQPSTNPKQNLIQCFFDRKVATKVSGHYTR